MSNRPRPFCRGRRIGSSTVSRTGCDTSGSAHPGGTGMGLSGGATRPGQVWSGVQGPQKAFDAFRYTLEQWRAPLAPEQAPTKSPYFVLASPATRRAKSCHLYL